MLIVAIHILELLIDEAAMPRGMQVLGMQVLGIPPTISFGEGLRKAGVRGQKLRPEGRLGAGCC